MDASLPKYLNLLFDGLEGYVYAPVKSSTAWTQKFFQWPSEATELQDWITTSDLEPSSHVYISPAIYSEPVAKKSSVKTLQCAWIEFDGNATLDFPPDIQPTAIVQSSFETHLHCYWRVEPSSKESVEDVNRRLTYYLGADTSGWDCTQLLRPPSTVNKKREQHLPVLLASISDKHYSIADFDRAPTLKADPLEVIEYTALPDWQVVLRRNLSTRIIQMVKIDIPPVGSRSSFMVRLAYELAEEGFNHLEIISLLHHADSRIKKFEGRTDQLLRLTQIAELAVHKIVSENSLAVYTIQGILKQDAIEWVLEPWLPRNGLMMLSSAPNVGKTQLGLQLTSSLARGENFLGLNTNASIQHSIFFMSLEMEPAGLRYIIERQGEIWSSSQTNYHISAGEEGTLVQYENLFEEHQPTVVFIDSLTELIDLVDADNDTAKARLIMKWIRKIRRRFNCAVLLIHHNRKATEGNKKPKGLADLAGSFEFARVSDTVIQMWDMEIGNKIEISGVKVRYGQKEKFEVVRDPDTLLFSRVGDVSNGTKPVQSDQSGISLDFDPGSRH